MGNRSPAFRDRNNLFKQISKFTDRPSLVLLFEKYVSWDVYPLVIARSSFLLGAAPGIPQAEADSPGALAILLAAEAAKKKLEIELI
jgi:hypothetical protein